MDAVFFSSHALVAVSCAEKSIAYAQSREQVSANDPPSTEGVATLKAYRPDVLRWQPLLSASVNKASAAAPLAVFGCLLPTPNLAVLRMRNLSDVCKATLGKYACRCVFLWQRVCDDLLHFAGLVFNSQLSHSAANLGPRTAEIDGLDWSVGRPRGSKMVGHRPTQQST